MSARKFDPVRDVLDQSLERLRVQIRAIRRQQYAMDKVKGHPDPELTAQVGAMARSVAALTAEIRKSGKDMRDRGSKWSDEQGCAAIVAYLKTLPTADLNEVLSHFRGGQSVADNSQQREKE